MEKKQKSKNITYKTLVIIIFAIIYCIYTRPFSIYKLLETNIENSDLQCNVNVSKIDLSSGKISSSNKAIKLNNVQTKNLNDILDDYKYRRKFQSIFSNKSSKISNGVTIYIQYYSQGKDFNQIIINKDGNILDSIHNNVYHIGVYGDDKAIELFNKIEAYIKDEPSISS